MENLCFRDSVSLFVTMVLTVYLLLLPHLTLSSTYSRPDKFYVNCGSDSNVTYGNRTFVGDMSSGSNCVSFSKKGTKARNQSGSGIYETVRIFKRPSSYKFQLDSVGLNFVRLHFSVGSSQTELLTARFTVSATSGSTHHFTSLSLQNFNETPRVEEFLLMINSPEFEIRFVPNRKSMAFINAIEVFSAPNDLMISPDSDKNLHTVYRLNVGGDRITPENDTLGRTWSLDNDFLYQKDSARNISSTQKPKGTASATAFTAPDYVYQTAKTLNRSSMNETHTWGLMNVTWSFKVESNSRHFIRVHLCDILSNKSQNPDSDFYLYVNGNWRIDVKPSQQQMLVTPFYIDVVNVSDGSGFLNVSIGTKDPSKDAGFLNGLEVMEFLEVSSDHSYWVYVVPGCFAAALVLVMSLLFINFLKRRRRLKNNKSNVEITVWSPLTLYRNESSNNNYWPSGNLNLGLKIPLTDILSATKNFNKKWLIGKGGFGEVYKAILPDGSRAAIKRGKTGSGQGILEFHTEIHVLSRIRHRHLVSLKGYCDEYSEMILVYEFMEKGTLKQHLYGSDSPSLTWKQRLEICIGAARGLHYLHSGSEEAIIHRDVKSTNILLDENTVAKVADFGLSKLAVRNQDPCSTSSNVKGTFGYLDPEYVQTHILTEKSDVYAFGVVLLEVLCARPALDRDRPNEEVNLAVWAMFRKSKGKIYEIIDPTLSGQIEPNCLRKFLEITEKCLKNNSRERPSMGDVICDLEYVLRLQMIKVHKEPHDDSTATISSSRGSLVSDSFSSDKYGSTESGLVQR